MLYATIQLIFLSVLVSKMAADALRSLELGIPQFLALLHGLTTALHYLSTHLVTVNMEGLQLGTNPVNFLQKELSRINTHGESLGMSAILFACFINASTKVALPRALFILWQRSPNCRWRDMLCDQRHIVGWIIGDVAFLLIIAFAFWAVFRGIDASVDGLDLKYGPFLSARWEYSCYKLVQWVTGECVTDLTSRELRDV